MSVEKFIEVQSVSRQYVDSNDSIVQALQQVSLDVREGEFLSIIGPSEIGRAHV